MPTMTYTLTNFSRTNVDFAPGAVFTADATGTPVYNSVVTSGSLYLSNVMTYLTVGYLSFTLGSGTGTTDFFTGNPAAHAETVALTAFSNELLTSGSGTITFTALRTGGTVGNVINLRAGLTATLTLNYAPAYTICGAPSSVAVNATNVAPGANVTLSWSGAYAGNGMSISQYQIYRATSVTGSYSLLTTVNSSATSGSVVVSAPTDSGSAYYYKVVTVGSVAGYNSALSSAYATLTCSFSAPVAPSAVTIGGGTSAYVLSGANVTLAWSGATAGTNNPIKGYILYRNGSQYTTVTSTASSGSLSVPAHATNGSSYYYTVYTQGTYSNSAASVACYVYTYSAPSAPTSLSVSNPSPEAGTSVMLSWAGAAAGSYNTITGYDVYRATSATGSYTLLTSVSSTATSGSCAVTAHDTMGASYYYKVLTKGQRSSSALSAAYLTLTSKANTAPAAPAIAAPVSGKTIFNAQPRILVTVGADAEGHAQALTLAGYSASNTGNLVPGRKVVFRRSASLTASGAQTVSVTATDTMGLTSSAATRSFTYNKPAFTDLLATGTTPIKAAHMNELREMVADVRAYYGMAAYDWATTITAGVTSLALWASHVLELRAAIQEVAAFVNGWDTASTTHNIVLPAWIDIPSNKPTVAVMNQLREVVALL